MKYSCECQKPIHKHITQVHPHNIIYSFLLTVFFSLFKSPHLHFDIFVFWSRPVRRCFCNGIRYRLAFSMFLRIYLNKFFFLFFYISLPLLQLFSFTHVYVCVCVWTYFVFVRFHGSFCIVAVIFISLVDSRARMISLWCVFTCFFSFYSC